MNLYHALQGLLDKVNETAVDAKYGKTEKEMLVAVLENQVRLGEALLVLGSLVHGIVGQEITIEVKPPKGAKTH